MIYGILIGFILAFIVDFLLTYFIKEGLSTVLIGVAVMLCKIIYSYIMPLIRLDISVWLVKHHHNPWHMSISEMLNVPDNEFKEWLVLVGKKNRRKWEEMRSLRKEELRAIGDYNDKIQERN